MDDSQNTDTQPIGDAVAPGDARGRGYCGRDGHRHRRGGRLLALLLVALIAGTAGGFIGKSFAHGHGFMGGSAISDPAGRDARVESMMKRFASSVDATPVQREKLTDIARDAVRDIAPARERLRDARQQALALVKADSVDRDAMEKLRAEQMQLADTVSRRVTHALADAAEVLTPEQRQKVAAKWGRHIERWEHRAPAAFNSAIEIEHGEFSRSPGRGAVQS